VAQRFAHDLGVDATDEQRRGEGVSKIMEPDVRDAHRNGNPAEGVSQAVGVQVFARRRASKTSLPSTS
jgi:hypothetical protein